MVKTNKLTKNNLIFLLGLLLFVRFVIQPLIEYQDELKSELVSAQTMSSKQQSMLQSDISKDTDGLVAEDLKELESELSSYETDSNFQLDTQRRIEQIASNNEVEIEVFTWLETNELVSGYLYTHTAQVEMTGSITNIIQVQLDMIEALGGVSVNEFSLRPGSFGFRRRPASGAPLVRVSSVFNIGGVKHVE